jgi:diphthamide biosynthesis protein 3
MSGFYDEIEIEDFDYDAVSEMYSYPCPCGDKFLISKVLTVDGRMTCCKGKKLHDVPAVR